MPRKNRKSESPLQSELPLPEMIGFRLDDESTRILVQRAARLNVSPGKLAQIYVVEMMYQAEERAVLREAIDGLKDGLEKLAASHALAVEALLASAGRLDEKYAHDWVNLNLRDGTVGKP